MKDRILSFVKRMNLFNVVARSTMILSKKFLNQHSRKKTKMVFVTVFAEKSKNSAPCQKPFVFFDLRKLHSATL